MRAPARNGLLVVALCGVVYANALSHGFVYDDWDLIVHNSWLRHGHLVDAFRLGYWETSRGGSFYYRPVVSLSYWLDWRLSAERPFGYHLTNLILHTASSLLVMLLSARWLRSSGAALAAAALFAVHPVHTQSVTWIAGRTDLLATLFFLAALALLETASARAGRARFAADAGSLLALGLALLSKEVAVTYPLVLLMRERAGETRRRWWAAAGAATVLAVYFAARVAVVGSLAGSGNDPHAWWTQADGTTSRLMTVPALLGFYLSRILLPWNLAFESGIQPVRELSQTQFWAPVSALSLLIVLAWWMRRREPAVVFGLAWFFVTLAPVANVFPIFESAMEHFAYLPSVGLIVALVGLGRSLVRPPPLRVALAGIMVALLGARAIARNPVWKDEETFWRAAVRDAPSARAWNNLGLHLADSGRLDEAHDSLSRVQALEPSLPASYTNLGIVSAKQGKRVEAIDLFGRALALDPANADALFNLALLLETNERGERYGTGFPAEEALSAYRALLAAHPDQSEGWTNLGVLYERLGRQDEAVAAFERALGASPDMPEPHAFLGSILWQRGQHERAAALYRRYLDLDPGGEYAEEARARASP